MIRAVACAVLFAFPVLASPGEEWEISIEVSMPGMPPGAMPPSKTRACGPKRDDSAMPFNPSMSQDSGCRVSDTKKTGQTWTWKLDCESGVTGGGSITLQGKEAFTGESTMQVQGQNITSKMSGKLIGPCESQGTPAPAPLKAPRGKMRSPK